MIDPIQQVTRLADKHGIRGAARELGMDAGNLHKIIQGTKPISPQLLEALGLERVVTYRRRK